ncbi:MAG: CDP-diacylglycerol--glycerol-3-phosphate 3-phosphatidyltransferase [Ignavibacteriales bacterium]
MSVPNFITVSRFFLIPIFVYLMLNKQYEFAIGVFLFAGFTDVLDGYIARKYNKVTDLGKILDPIADKTIQLAVLLMIVITNIVPNVLPLLIIVLLKEIMMAIGSGVLWGKGVVVQAFWYGKFSTVVFYVAVALSIILKPYGKFFLIIAVISQVFAFLMYLKSYVNINKSFRQTEKS